MANITLAQLLDESTEEESLQMMLTILQSLGFAASSWQPGSRYRTIVQMVAVVHSDFTSAVASMTRGRYNDSATGDWLDALSESHYDNQRVLARATQFKVVYDADDGAGPYTIALNDSIAKDSDGREFRNEEEGILPEGGSLTLLFAATVPAATPMPGPGMLSLVTPLAGVTIEATELVVAGVDDEDDKRLRVRNATKWAQLGYASPEDVYRLWALEASPEVTRVKVDSENPGGPGTVYVYIAGDAELEQRVADEVEDYINGTDGVGRRPIGALVSVFPAEDQIIAIVATIYIDPTYGPELVEANVHKSLEDYADEVSIGGIGGVVPLAGIYRAIMTVPGVVNASIPTPAVDVPIAANGFPEFAQTLTFVEI